VGEPFGIRNVQGLFNNISLASSAIWGAAFYAFARSSDADYDSYVQQRTGNAAFKTQTDVSTLASNPFSTSALWSSLSTAQKSIAQGNTNYGVVINANGSVDLSNRYANPFLTVSDYSPRMISQLVDSQAALERVDAASGGAYITDNSFYQIKDINTGGVKLPTYDINGVVKTDGTGTYGYKPTGTLLPDGTPEYTLASVSAGGTYFKESIQRNLNTLGGDPSLTGWNTLFGQFFDHGLDFIGKGGNTINGVSSKVYIPLDVNDPLYRAPNLATGDPGNTRLSISRATVANPEAAGADGMFRTADDIQSPGADGLYGTADDIKGLANPNYVNHTSPYIDQSQTYGSDDTTTNLLREWVPNPKFDPSKAISATNPEYIPGMKLLDGHTLANPWVLQDPLTPNATYAKAGGGYNQDGTPNPAGNFALGTLTTQTLPTLNELRAYLKATGRDDLTWEDIGNLRVRDANGKVLDIDPNTAGIQAAYTGHTLIADFLPRFDAAHINAADLTALFPSYTGNVASYVDVNSGQPTALGLANPAILNELLLRSIGDHYVAGDGRANENFGLTAIHHVWHENHNWQIDNLINIIAQQQAADPTHSVAHAFQIDTGNGKDAQGNYLEKISVKIFDPNPLLGYKYVDQYVIAWDEEKMFQAATLINQGEYQHVAIDQYARGLTPNIPLFAQYDSGVNADVTLDYSQVAFRFGHSQLRETIDTLDPLGSLTGAITHYALEQAFLNPAGFAQVGPTAIALGMSRQFSNEIDEIVTPALQQNLLGQATDLAAINIARARDLGMPTLNNLRRELSAGLTAELNALNQKLIANPGDTTLKQTIDKTIVLQAGLQAYSSWADFGANIQHPEGLVNFIAAYSFDGDLVKAQALIKLSEGASFSSLSAAEQAKVNASIANGGLGWNFASDVGYAIVANQFLNGGDQGYEAVDAWNGGLAEKHVFLGELGSTFDAIFADQMTRLINGDRFYYFWRFQLGLPIFTELNSAIATEQFKDVIERTTGANHLVGNVFFAADSYVELSEKPKDPSALGDAISGIDRDHKYGDLLAKASRTNYDGSTTSLLDAAGQHIGVASIGGTNETLNGYVTERITGKNANGTNIVEKFILDVRPDIGVNPDGTAVEGFNSHEVIGGTKFRDYIDAGDGDDTIYGDAGDDILLGNAGADHIYGEAGNDLIYGGALPDFLDGGIGDDEIHGGDDADVLIGAEGNDKLFGENFTDELHGGAGDDYLDGGLDADFIYGGEGQDIVVGGEGLDTTYGEWGDDRMFGGAGPDQLFGGYGDDILNAGFGGQNQNVNVDEALGEFGFNMVSFSDSIVTLNHSADLNQENINISNVTPFGQLWVNIQGVEGSQFADELIGYNGSGTVDATLIGNWLIGGGGNDKITTGSGDDVIVGDSVRLDALIGTYSGGVLQANGILDTAYGAAAGAAKHFLDLLKSAPDFTFGDTVNITANGLVYTHQATPGIDTAIYTGARTNFTITNILAPNSSTVLGFKIVDKTGVETGTNGDVVLGVENFSFNGIVIAAQNLVRTPNGTMQVSGYASANQPNAVPTTALPASAFPLTAAVTDPDGVSGAIAYQWQYSTDNGTTWQTVAGATASTFKPTNPAGNSLVPLGAVIRSVADYTDIFGTVEHVVSAPTEAMGFYSAGGNNTDTLFGSAHQDVIFGNGGNDTLSGLAGNDYLDGGTGNDSMYGGTGNDIYVVNSYNSNNLNNSDQVVENLNEGTDTVFSSVTYTLPANVENLTLTGNSNINATGNGLDNILTGNSGNNTLNGGLGADTLIGGLGNDTYVVDNSLDAIIEAINAGTDTVESSITWTLGANIENLTLTGNGNINGIGNALDNILTGNSGINTLSGGLGNDTYVVGTGDTVVEALNEGIDLVQSSITWTLGDNIENLTLTGNNNINGIGNALDNILTGNTGNNVLTGGLGNDIYVVQNTNDSAVEAANAGIDLVQSSVSWTLGLNFENLTLTGNNNIDGTGNALNNILTGNSGRNTLSGGLGNDTLNLGSDNSTDIVRYAFGDGSDTVNGFVRNGNNADQIRITGVQNVDVVSSGGSTFFRVGDGIQNNPGFGSGQTLLTLVGVTGFNNNNIGNNLANGNTAQYRFN
jgi:Ca2+-binding RTX toxin-like protein